MQADICRGRSDQRLFQFALLLLGDAIAAELTWREVYTNVTAIGDDVEQARYGERVMLRKAISLIVALGICSVFVSAGEAADPSAVKRVELHRSPVPNSNYDVIVTRVEVQPNSKVGLHTHPGIESGYALSGTLTVGVMGQAVTKLAPGDTFLVPANALHVVESGPQGYVGIHTYAVDRTQPIVVMAK